MASPKPDQTTKSVPGSPSGSQGAFNDASSPGDNRSLRDQNHEPAKEPQRNKDGKMVCGRRDCSERDLVFDRRCEWQRHEDKHDRPYKCTLEGCEKLKGFTYNGGLLRHNREVHKMYGGNSKTLFCPVNDCKRSSGVGFTRKENLAEHIRRVHRRTTMSADMQGSKWEGAGGDTVISDRGDKMRRISISGTLPGSKRKRTGSISDGDDEQMWNEIDELKKKDKEISSKLTKLEQIVMALEK